MTQPAPKPKKRYSCSLCPKTFTTTGHVSRHMRIHSNLKPFNCPIDSCDSWFARLDNMKQHYKSHLRRLGIHHDDLIPQYVPSPILQYQFSPQTSYTPEFTPQLNDLNDDACYFNNSKVADLFDGNFTEI